MKKEQMEKLIKKQEEKIKQLDNNNDFLLKQQKQFKQLAEKVGSELAPYKAMVLRLKEELERLDSTIKLLEKGDKI